VRLPPTVKAAAVVTVTVDPLLKTRLPLMVAFVSVFAPLPESVTLLNVYAKGAIACAAPSKLTVLEEHVKVPAVPLIKVPPAFKVPAPENTI